MCSGFVKPEYGIWHHLMLAPAEAHGYCSPIKHDSLLDVRECPPYESFMRFSLCVLIVSSV